MLNNSATKPAPQTELLKRVHGLIRHSEDKNVKRAAGMLEHEIKKSKSKTE
jgi:hypothetical protein